MLENELINRRKYLNTLIHKAQDVISDTPDNKLKIKTQGSKIYYIFNGHYLKKEDYGKACSTANRTYCEKVLKLASKESALLEKLLGFYNTYNLADIYENMNVNRKKLVCPLEISDKSYSHIWQNTPFEKKQLNTTFTFLTERNEKVRSKSEVIIANYLNTLKIPYKYECPHTLGDKVFYPDFTILNVKTRKEIIFEHFGMMDDESYRNNAFDKVELYAHNGYIPGVNFIYTFESKSHPLNISTLETLLKTLK